MKNKEQIKEIYTQYLNFYHFMFCNIFKYDKGIRSFINNSSYLHSNMKVLDA